MGSRVVSIFIFNVCKQLAHPKSINELPIDIERIGLGVYSKPIGVGRKKRSKKGSEAITSRVLTFKEGTLLVEKNALIFPELLSFDLTILKRRKRN